MIVNQAPGQAKVDCYLEFCWYQQCEVSFLEVYLQEAEFTSVSMLALPGLGSALNTLPMSLDSLEDMCGGEY